MNDPHVEALYYDFVSEIPSDKFDQAIPLNTLLGTFSVELKNGKLLAQPKIHFSDEEDAKAALKPLLRSWESAALLSESRFRIRFIYRKASVIDRNPTPGMVSLRAQSLSTVITTDKATLNRFMHEFPAPDPSFQASPLTDDLLSLLREYRDGHMRLTTMANLVLGILQNEFGNRKNVSEKLQVSREVLNTLGTLSSSTDLKYGRKARGLGPASLTSIQLQWLDSATVQLIYKVGEINAGTPITQITMQDFPDI